MPLYRLFDIMGRSGLVIPASTLGQWVGQTGVALQPMVDALKEFLLTRRVLHADETPVAMLDPGACKTKRAYVWSYCTTVYDSIQGVVYDFAESRAGQHAKSLAELCRPLTFNSISTSKFNLTSPVACESTRLSNKRVQLR